MEIKKNPKSNLENYSKLFVQLGLVVALFVTYVTIEKKTYEEQDIEALGQTDMGDALEEETVMLNTPPPPPPPPPTEAPPPPPAPEKLDIKDDKEEVEETILQDTESDEEEAVETVDVEDIETVEEPVEEVIEEVPFAVIEEVPEFPGCTGSKAEKRKCLEKKMRKHAAKNFNADLANELGLKSGKHRIMAMFKIDKTGSVSGIQVRAPHPRLKKEAERIIKKLPKMKPGKQRGKPVAVKYVLPFGFVVE